jgi:2-phosphosulfolactate phosphatase
VVLVVHAGRGRLGRIDDMHWHCHELYHRMPSGAVAGGIAVVIDVLRASTTIVTALAHGAAAVAPRRSIEEALAAAADRPGAVLGGERGGVMIAGFDLGNSPLEYAPDRVAGRPVVITTTNGTAALAVCRDAAEVLVGAIVNRTAVAATARRLAAERGCEAIHLVCAGTDGQVTEEDVLAAGAILDAAGRDSEAVHDTLDLPARAARRLYRDLAAPGREGLPDRIATAFRTCRGGENLLALGMAADLPVAAAIDSLAIVPRLDRRGDVLVACA